MEDKDYISNVYSALKDNLQGFDKSEPDFRKEIQNKDYADKVYKALGDNLQGFDKKQDEFYSNIGLKKKDQTTSPKNTGTDAGEGSKPAKESPLKSQSPSSKSQADYDNLVALDKQQTEKIQQGAFNFKQADEQDPQWKQKNPEKANELVNQYNSLLEQNKATKQQIGNFHDKAADTIGKLDVIDKNLQQLVPESKKEQTKEPEKETSFYEGTAKAMNKSLISTFDALDGASKYIEDMSGGLLKRGGAFKDIADFYRGQNENLKDTPDNLMGHLVSGLSEMVPDLVMSMAAPEKTIYGLETQFGAYLAGKSFFGEYDKSQDVIKSSEEWLKGGAEGIGMTLLGYPAEAVGGKIANKALKYLAKGATNAATFATQNAAQQYAETGQVNTGQVEEAAGTGAAFTAAEAGKFAFDKAWSRIIQTPYEQIKTINEIPKSAEELRGDAIDNSSDKSKEGQAKSVISGNLADIKGMSKAISDNPTMAKEEINNSTELSDEQKQENLTKIDKIQADYINKQVSPETTALQSQKEALEAKKQSYAENKEIKPIAAQKAIGEIDNEITELQKKIDESLKPKKNAIQEQSTGALGAHAEREESTRNEGSEGLGQGEQGKETTEQSEKEKVELKNHIDNEELTKDDVERLGNADATAQKQFADYIKGEVEAASNNPLAENEKRLQEINDYLEYGKTLPESVAGVSAEQNKQNDEGNKVESDEKSDKTEANGQVKKENDTNVEGEKNEGLLKGEGGDKSPDTEDTETTKMANAINDAHIEGKFGTEALEKVISKLQDTNLEKIYNNLKDKIKDGTVDVNKVRERVILKLSGSELDQAALLYDAAELKGKESEITKNINKTADIKDKISLQEQLIDVQNKLMDNALANRAIGRSASSIFRLRQLWVDKSANLLDFTDEYKASKGINEITPEQEKEIKTHYEKIKDLEGRIKELEASDKKNYEEKVNTQRENEVIKKLNDKSKEQRRQDRAIKSENAIKNSQSRVEKSKGKLQALKKKYSLSAGVNPEFALEISKIAAEKVYQGAVKLDEIAQNVLDEIKDIFPKFTIDDVKEHLAYSKENKPRTEESKILSTAKKTAKLEQPEKVYSTTEKVPYEKSKKLKDAEKEYALERLKWDRNRRSDLMDHKSDLYKIGDMIKRYQRFAILQYPGTLVKLGNVVLQGLINKPIKFAIQSATYATERGIESGLNKINPVKYPDRSITSKQFLYGKPRLKALANYYSEFYRNFSLDNLKEHLMGVDSHEAQFGKPFIYEEWKASTGWLEIPGRSHGYIKSFIKNPEFAYANETLSQSTFEKAADIHDELNKEYLTEADRNKLKKEADQYDLTNPDVQNRIGALSLEHARWSILMNDNQITNLVNSALEDKGIGADILRTEVPIVKIPLNYIGRYFASKYGLLTALTGRRNFFKKDSPVQFKGLISLIYNGTKDLSTEHAELLGRTISQGSIGAMYFTLGYLLKNKIVNNEDGSKEVMGVHVSNLLVHYPEYESLFSGAETAQKMKSGEGSGKGDFIKYLVESDADVMKKSPFIQMVTNGFLANMAKAYMSKSDERIFGKVSDAVAKKTSDAFLPGLLKTAASAKDAIPGSRNKSNFGFGVPEQRKPDGENWERFIQQWELGIPGLRKKVPLRNNPLEAD